MAKAEIHAASSARRFGGVAADYLDIHVLMDSSKKCFADNRHRCLTHNSWFIAEILPKIFGRTMVNSAGKTFSVIDVAEQHILEDFGMQFIPTPQDYLQEMELLPWMNNGKGARPSSATRLPGESAKYQIVD